MSRIKVEPVLGMCRNQRLFVLLSGWVVLLPTSVRLEGDVVVELSNWDPSSSEKAFDAEVAIEDNAGFPSDAGSSEPSPSTLTPDTGIDADR